MTASRNPAPRFWIDVSLSPGAGIELSETARRHVAALRLKEGDEITLFNGAGGEYAARLGRIARDRAFALAGIHRDIERESPLRITLALGLSAGDRMDFAIQKATELGVARILPLSTERSVVRLSEDRAGRRVVVYRLSER